jgi:hypothetical protein
LNLKPKKPSLKIDKKAKPYFPGSTLMEFNAHGMNGIAREKLNGKKIELCCIYANKRGEGSWKKFFKRLKKTYDEIWVMISVNERFYAHLETCGFERRKTVQCNCVVEYMVFKNGPTK